MPRLTDRGDDLAGRAAALARDVAGDIDAILLTHYPDADTLDTLRPGETDLDAVAAVNRAVAAEMIDQGVEIFVQKADRAAFRRWMHGRDDTPEVRRSWINRAGLLRGAAACRMLGLDGPAAPPAPTFGTAPGPIADRLIAAANGEDGDDGEDFDALAQGLLQAGRNDVMDLALRKMAERHGDDTAEALLDELLAAAEGAPIGPSGWAELVTLPVALPLGGVPDAEAMADGFIRAGIEPETAELRFLPGWRSPDAVAGLSPAALRGVLADLVAKAEPRDVPPGDTDDLARRGFGILLGLRIDWSIPIWEEIVAAGGLPPAGDPDAETPDEASRAGLFDTWRGAMFDAWQGCVPLALVPPSALESEIAGFLEEAGEQTGAIDDIRQFIAVARGEAGAEDIVCRPEIADGGLELSAFTVTGRFLDSFALPAARMPASAEEMLRVVGSFVLLVPEAPGR